MDTLKDPSDSESGSIRSKILELVCSQQNGLEVKPNISISPQDPTFDYQNIAPLPEGEDTQTLSNFCNLLSKALPIDQVNIMLQQELERRRKSLISYQTKCNEAEYLLPKLVAQEEALSAKLKGISEDIKLNDERLQLINSEYDSYRSEQGNLDKQIDQARQNLKRLNRKLECCNKIQENMLKLSDAKNHSSNSHKINALKFPSSQTIEDSSESYQQTTSLTTDNMSVTSSPAKSLTSDNKQMASSFSDSHSIKNENSLSEGEIIDTDSGDISDTNSDLDDIDEM